MPGPLTILQHSPWWIYPLLLLLVWFGVRGMRPRTLPIWRLAIVPLVFIGWGIVSILSRPTASGGLIADWLVCAAVGAGTARLSTRRMTVAIDSLRGKVTLQGSIGPLVRNLLVFAMKYAVGVAMALLPTRRAEIALLDIGVSGAMAGYFLGWLGRIIGTLPIWGAALSGYQRPYTPAVRGHSGGQGDNRAISVNGH
jgi:hypothetical protein